jgi:hypothetical protein
LVAYPFEIENTPWGCEGTLISGADGTAIGTGFQNTLDIVNSCGASGSAAELCANLTFGGYSDWYLPSKNELFVVLQNHQAINANLGFYWSSTEYDANSAWQQQRSNNFQINSTKSTTLSVRPIRSF